MVHANAPSFSKTPRRRRDRARPREPFDLAIPCEVFGRARLADGRAPYRVRVCGVTKTIDAGAFRIHTAAGLGAVADADTVIVPGIEDPARPIPRALLTALRTAAANETLPLALAVERIAAEVGFGSATTFRERFQRIVGTSPQGYRRSFRQASPT